MALSMELAARIHSLVSQTCRVSEKMKKKKDIYFFIGNYHHKIVNDTYTVIRNPFETELHVSNNLL